ncbi:hypothetical protein HGRIS_006788 [Hohenbuehelia grisea]|uniref:Uncharacterized protein n=1 Tax=Hohenbuehelia grisea TaxID=104357 RepID=A0ABR3JAC2_9AGAR
MTDTAQTSSNLPEQSLSSQPDVEMVSASQSSSTIVASKSGNDARGESGEKEWKIHALSFVRHVRTDCTDCNNYGRHIFEASNDPDDTRHLANRVEAKQLRGDLALANERIDLLKRELAQLRAERPSSPPHKRPRTETIASSASSNRESMSTSSLSHRGPVTPSYSAPAKPPVSTGYRGAPQYAGYKSNYLSSGMGSAPAPSFSSYNQRGPSRSSATSAALSAQSSATAYSSGLPYDGSPYDKGLTPVPPVRHPDMIGNDDGEITDEEDLIGSSLPPNLDRPINLPNSWAEKTERTYYPSTTVSAIPAPFIRPPKYKPQGKRPLDIPAFQEGVETFLGKGVSLAEARSFTEKNLPSQVEQVIAVMELAHRDNEWDVLHVVQKLVSSFGERRRNWLPLDWICRCDWRRPNWFAAFKKRAVEVHATARQIHRATPHCTAHELDWAHYLLQHAKERPAGVPVFQDARAVRGWRLAKRCEPRIDHLPGFQGEILIVVQRLAELLAVPNKYREMILNHEVALAPTVRVVPVAGSTTNFTVTDAATHLGACRVTPAMADDAWTWARAWCEEHLWSHHLGALFHEVNTMPHSDPPPPLEGELCWVNDEVLHIWNEAYLRLPSSLRAMFSVVNLPHSYRTPASNLAAGVTASTANPSVASGPAPSSGEDAMAIDASGAPAHVPHVTSATTSGLEGSIHAVSLSDTAPVAASNSAGLPPDP